MWIIPIFLGIGFYVYVKKVFVSQNVVKTKTIRKRRHRRNKFRNLPNKNNCKIEDSDDEIEFKTDNSNQVWCHDYKQINISNDIRLVELAYNDLKHNKENITNLIQNVNLEKNTEETKVNSEETEVNIEETKLNTEETKVNTEETKVNTEETKVNSEETELNIEETKDKILSEKKFSNSPINKMMENEVKNDNISDTSSNTSSTHLSSDYTNINYDDIKDIM